MKKNIFMFGSLFGSIISLVLAIYSYNIDKSIYGIFFLVLGIILIGVYSLILGKNLKLKMDKKKSIMFPIISLIIYTVLYGTYMTLFNVSINLNFITYASLLVLFYVSFFNYILMITCSFYYWNLKKIKRTILNFLILAISFIIISLTFSLLFKSLPVVIVEAIKFIYFTSLISLFMYVLTFVFQKIIFPISK